MKWFYVNIYLEEKVIHFLNRNNLTGENIKIINKSIHDRPFLSVFYYAKKEIKLAEEEKDPLEV